jgi:RHS repeat-associated protein
VLEETDLSGNLLNDYVYLAGQRVARRDSSGSVFYYYTDPLVGSTLAIYQSSGSLCYQGVYYPFGGEKVYTNTCAQNYKFTGLERDAESGVDQTKYRVLSSNTGRWLSPDRLGGRISNPQSLNRYAYVLNNPATLIDPLGLDDCPAGWICVTSWAPDPNGDSGSGGSVHPPLQDDPGPSGTRGSPSDGLADLPPSQGTAILNAFNALWYDLGNLSSDCLKHVIQPLTKSLGFNLGAFVTYLGHGADFYNGLGSNALIAGTVTTAQAANNSPFFPGETIAQAFNTISGGQQTVALTSIMSPTLEVFLNPKFINRSNKGVNGQNLALLFHEALHGYGGSLGGTSYFDADLRSAFGLPAGCPSSQISDYIQKHCF